MSMTDSNDTIGNRTRDLPQPRAPNCFLYFTDMATSSLSILVLSIINEQQAYETPLCPQVRVVWQQYRGSTNLWGENTLAPHTAWSEGRKMYTCC
jgi:hypothetical protein